ncbi:hypothetical protein DV735_g5289, partial [Chaetothyriales sp. CBS 134920]
MARPVHAETLFHLEPLDATTRAILDHTDNTPFVSLSSEGRLALEIGYHVSSKPRGGRVIARLGRDADLILPAKTIAQVHLAFEVHPISHAILLCVRAENTQSVKVEPGGFRPGGHLRQVVLDPGINNYEITVGENVRPFHFAVRWRLDISSTAYAVDNGFQAAQARAVNPRWFKTEDDSDYDIRSWYTTRLQSGVIASVRHAQLGQKLGVGSYGSVHRGIDLDSGHLIAVKVVEPQDEKQNQNLYREIKTLQTLSHPHIIDFFGHKGWTPDGAGADCVQIFMPLRTGSVYDLAPLPKETEQAVILQLSYQMLSALDYLSSRKLCHRDIKPANILYDVVDGNYTFQLADFGLANHQQWAETVCGTRVFAAPELHPDYGLGKYHQSPKMDVWSLFVTVASLMTAANFDRQKLATRGYSEILGFVEAVATHLLPGLQPMARENPELRASAAQMLVLHFDGQGLTTRRSEWYTIARTAKAKSSTRIWTGAASGTWRDSQPRYSGAALGCCCTENGTSKDTASRRITTVGTAEAWIPSEGGSVTTCSRGHAINETLGCCKQSCEREVAGSA